LNVSTRTLTAFITVAAVAVAAGYYAGTRKGSQSPPADTTAEAPPAGTAQAPASHPPIGDDVHGSAPAGSATLLPGHPAAPGSGKAPPPESGRAHLDTEVDPDAKFTHFRVGDRNVKQILADGDTMWVGTSGGVIKYNTKTDDYKLYDNRSGLLANGIFHISKLDGRLVVGTYGGGMSILDEAGQNWKTYNIPHGLGDAFVYDVLKADNGDVWIATWSGANRIKQGKLDDRSAWELYTVENTSGGLPNDWVYGLAMGKNGEIWMATEGGLARFKDGQWDNWNHEQGQGAEYELVKDQIQFTNDPANYSKHHTKQKSEMGLEQVSVAYNPNYIVALLIDDDGSVWAGTWGGGLAHFDGESWENFTMKDGLPANHIFSLHSDEAGKLMVGTSNGLAVRDDNGGFRIFNTSDGLFSNIVFSMATAADGSSWIGSFGGVARIARLQ
jgi:ligand-binding sensor domain-containing protein